LPALDLELDHPAIVELIGSRDWKSTHEKARCLVDQVDRLVGQKRSVM